VEGGKRESSKKKTEDSISLTTKQGKEGAGLSFSKSSLHGKKGLRKRETNETKWPRSSCGLNSQKESPEKKRKQRESPTIKER